MNILRKMSYAVDDFCCRHNKGIMKTFWCVAAFVCAAGVICCATMAILLAGNMRELLAGEEGNWFAYIFCIGWLIASVVATGFCLCWYVQCTLRLRDRNYAL